MQEGEIPGGQTLRYRNLEERLRYIDTVGIDLEIQRIGRRFRNIETQWGRLRCRDSGGEVET